jgi:Carboxypeptidase regulatory-like domain/TonB dependent receptor
MTRRFIAITALMTVLFVTLATSAAFGQAVYGSILGTVTDPQGAAVAGAKVTVTDQRKGTSDQTTTNDSGNYSTTHLIPDIYTVEVEAPGFKKLTMKDINVSADAAARVDGQFQVGATSESVEVTAEAPQLKTDRADVAVTFNEKYVEEIPILNRNFTQLQLLSPGSQKIVGWSHAATENPQGGQQIFTQGQHFSGTAFELDGTDNQDPILGIIVVNPNLDAVTEAKVALQNYDAEFGKAVASVVTAQTKSGSNDLHGSGFWFRRSDAQQARDPFTQFAKDPFTGRYVPRARWQQFGGTIGGPIIKDKLFFFGDYQGTRQVNGVSGTFTMPTATVRNSCNPATNTTGFCDLSEYARAGINGGGLIFDPNTGLPDGSGRTQFCGPLGCTLQPNWIPMNAAAALSVGHPANSVLSPISAAILQQLPAPSGTGVLNNFIGSGSGPFSQNGFDTRIDYTASSTINVFGRFSLNYYSLSGKGLLGVLGGPGNGLLGLAGSSITHNYSLATGFTKTFSASLLTDFRFGYFKYNPKTQKPDGGTPMNDFGIGSAPGGNLANTSDPKTAGLGSFQLGKDPISGYNGSPNNGEQGLVISSFGDGLGVARCNCPLTESEQQFQWVNNWTKLKGNHQIKFGADIRYAMNLRVPSDNNRTGEYNFSPQGTSNKGNGGLDLATFLLGDVTSFARYVTNPALPSASNAAERQKRWFFYGQDTFRATSKLTINYGLRWEIYFPETVNAKGNGGFANINDLGGTGAIRVAGFGNIGSNGNIDNKLSAFAPRLGIAYQLTPKTVIRMGYGRSYDIGVFGSNFGHTVTQNLPVLLKQNIDASAINLTANIDPLFNLAQGPPLGVFPVVPSNGVIPFAALASQVSGVHIRPTRQTLPTVDAWNATVQRQVTNTLSLEASYVGSKGTHGFAGNGPNYDVNPVSIVNFNQINPVTGKTYTQNQRRPLCGAEDALGNCTRLPFSLGNYYGNDAGSNYNSFQLKVDKRFSQGLQFLAHYTFSHANNFSDTYYAVNHDIAWGPVDFNRNHVFVINTVYELPFGKGKMFMGNVGKGLNYVVGGWQLSNTTNWSSGLPWTPSTNECGNEQDVNVCRPNKGSGSFHVGTGSFNPITHTVTYFTPLATQNPNGTFTSQLLSGPAGGFSLPGQGQLGNIGRNSFHGPSGFYSDLSVVKAFPITEKLRAQFRMDAFNVFNHPVYAFSANNGANPCIDCGGGNNGKITGLESGTSMRQLQFAIRFDF